MVNEVPHCPECNASWQDGQTCQDRFHQMLFWENEHPPLGEVHHLMVLCYHLQHPGLYAPEELEYAKGLLVDFVERGLSPQHVRRRSRDQVDSGKRAWKVKATASARGAYTHPVRWSLTSADIAAAGADRYVEQVRLWARAVLADLKESQNL